MSTITTAHCAGDRVVKKRNQEAPQEAHHMTLSIFTSSSERDEADGRFRRQHGHKYGYTILSTTCYYATCAIPKEIDDSEPVLG